MTAAEIIDHLAESAIQPADLPVVAGFDAFVDDLLNVVESRTSPSVYEPMETIGRFAEWAAGSAGRSGLRECVVKDRVAGGCTVNLGDGLLAMGFPLHAFSGVGEPPDPVFAEFVSRCASHHSVGMNPGHTAAYEFHDGKLMLCSISHFAELTPERLRESGGAVELRERAAQASAIVLTSWSVYPHMTECWGYLQRSVLSGLQHRPRILIDIADPASRAPEDVVAMVDCLGGFEAIGPTLLSINGNEANQIARAVGIRPAEGGAGDVMRLASDLRQRARIAEVGIHLIREAVVATGEGTFHAEGPHCSRPKKSVGAGDRFNSGWLAGHLFGLPPQGCLRFASAVSGFFVRTARSGTLPEILQFLGDWEDGNPDRRV